MDHNTTDHRQLDDSVHIRTMDGVDPWRVARAPTLGASEIGKLFGIGGTPLDLYVDKVLALDAIAAGQPPPQIEETEPMEIGNGLEDGVARIYQRRAQKLNPQLVIIAPPRFSLYTNDAYPHLHASPDRFIFPHQGPHGNTIGVLEIKTTGHEYLDDWDDESPLRVQAQVQAQMMVLGLGWGVACALIGTFGFCVRIQPVERDETFQRILAQESERFFDRHVLPRAPPPPTKASDSDSLRRLFSRALDKKTISLPASSAVDYDQVERCRDEESAAKDAKFFAQARLQIAMGDAELGILPDGRRVKWANEDAVMSARAEHTVKKRVLRLMKPETKRSTNQNG